MLGQQDCAGACTERWLGRNEVAQLFQKAALGQKVQNQICPEYGMPNFGFPHGYGLGQIDNTTLDPPPNPRGVSTDEAWDFIANLRLAVRMVMIQTLR